MKLKHLCGVLCAVFLLAGCCLPAAAAGYTLPEGTTVHASSAILVSLAGNPEGDVVLYEKEADAVHAPGSMMRYAVLAYALHRIQQKGLDIDSVTGTYTSDLFNHYVAGTGVNTAGMKYGETWTLRDLLQVSFMQSASDAVTVLAVTVDGDVKTFIDGMNTLAIELGCDYSHFANLTGLDSLSQYTTARDMYRIVRYAQSFSAFEALAEKYQVTVKPTAGGTERTIISANNMLQPSSSYRYDPLVHSRTGLSEHEGRACASVARDSGYEYLTVVLGCPEESADGQRNLHYLDTINLMKWGFKNFEYKTVLGKSEILASIKVDLSWDTDRLNVVPASEVATVIDKNLQLDQIIKKVTVYDEQITAPVTKGTVLGKVELIINVDQKIGEVDLVADKDIQRSSVLYGWSMVSGFFSSGWFFLGIGVFVLLIIAYVILNIVHNRRRRRNRTQRLGKGR